MVVSTNGGRHPQWSRTDNRLFFVARIDAPAQITVVDYTVQNGTFVPTTPRPWSSRLVMPRGVARTYALHPDGARVVAKVAGQKTEGVAASNRLVFVTNFSDELRRLTPPAR